MNVVVEVAVEGAQRPAPGSPIRVQIRDTSLADASDTIVAETRGSVRGEKGQWLETVEVSFDRDPRGCTVWAHVDVDETGRVSAGDFLTTVAYPVPRGADVQVRVVVKPV